MIAKLWPGKSEQQKQKLAAEITKAVMTTLHYGEESVSVAMEKVKASDWTEKVYKPCSFRKRRPLSPVLMYRRCALQEPKPRDGRLNIGAECRPVSV